MKQGIALVGLTLIALVVFASVVWTSPGAVVKQEDLAIPQVWAYRHWQRIGARVQSGQTLRIRAQGSWSYTPGEFHGPAGHPTYSAPTFYPVPHTRGGVLLGRVGEKGQPIVVGAATTIQSEVNGPLFLQINDDILSDNEGSLEIIVEVLTTTEEDSGEWRRTNYGSR